MIALKTLKLRNFISHKDTEITFSPTQKLLIDGNSGSGKSTIMEAIIWAFYGTGRSNNTSLVHTGSEKAIVTLTVDQEGEEIIIERMISAKGKHTLSITIDGIAHPKTGVRDLQDWIETDLTGASYLLFVNSVAYLQGGADNFVTQNSGKRKELLLEIIKTIDFDSYYDKVKGKINDYELEEAVIDTTIEASRNTIDEAKMKVLGKGTINKSLVYARGKEKTLKDNKEAIQIKIDACEEVPARLSEIPGEVIEAKTDILRMQDDIKRKNNLIDELKEEITVTPSISVEMMEESLTDTVGSIEQNRAGIDEVNVLKATKMALLESSPKGADSTNEIESLGIQIGALMGANTCKEGEGCPNFKATMNQVDTMRTKVEELEVSTKQYVEDKKLWDKKMLSIDEGKIARYDILVSELANLETVASDLRDSIERKNKLPENETEVKRHTLEVSVLFGNVLSKEEVISKLEAEKQELESDESGKDLDLYRRGLMEIEVEIDANKREQDNFVMQLGVIENFEKKIPKEEKKVEEGSKKKKEIQENLTRMGYLKEAFGSKGIRSLVIDYLLPELEEKINKILSRMSEFRVILDTQQGKASGEGSKEGLFITIVNDMGEEMPFENYSGGERLKIIVAITEALASLQKCGFRLFDEVWVGLDEMSLESFVEVLDTLLEKFPQVVCVSHLTEIKASFDDKITVTKHNGISNIN